MTEEKKPARPRRSPEQLEQHYLDLAKKANERVRVALRESIIAAEKKIETLSASPAAKALLPQLTQARTALAAAVKLLPAQEQKP